MAASRSRNPRHLVLPCLRNSPPRQGSIALLRPVEASSPYRPSDRPGSDRDATGLAIVLGPGRRNPDPTARAPWRDLLALEPKPHPRSCLEPPTVRCSSLPLANSRSYSKTPLTPPRIPPYTFLSSFGRPIRPVSHNKLKKSAGTSDRQAAHETAPFPFAVGFQLHGRAA